MVASVWTAPQAILIWFEFVKERRKDIQRSSDADKEVHYTNLAAATQAELSRSHLAGWNARARSWLMTANEIKRIGSSGN